MNRQTVMMLALVWMLAACAPAAPSTTITSTLPLVVYRVCERLANTPGGPARKVAFNNGGNEDMVWFYGLRAGTWYYVEIGNYD